MIHKVAVKYNIKLSFTRINKVFHTFDPVNTTVNRLILQDNLFDNLI